MRGRRISYSEAELRFVKERASMGRAELRAAFVAEFGREGVSIEAIKSLCSRKGWTTRRAWSDADDAIIRESFPNTRTEDLAKRLGRSVSSTYQRAYTLGLRKSAAFLASPASGRTNGRQGISSRFKKGHLPANKGKPMPFHPNSAATRFKKGQEPHNTKFAGHERVDQKDGYVYISVEQPNPHTGYRRRYVLKHKWLWEQANGPVPEGMALKCVGTDRQNCDPSNWTPVPRAILPRLNGKRGRSYDHAPAELKPTIMAVAKLEHATAQRRRRAAS